MKHDQLVLIHTPHLSDKAHGTKTVLRFWLEWTWIEKIWIDHVEANHRVRFGCRVLGRNDSLSGDQVQPSKSSGYFGKISAGKALGEFFLGWGPSDPFTARSVVEFRRRGHTLQEAIEVYHNNPCRFLGQNPKWDIKPITVSEE